MPRKYEALFIFAGTVKEEDLDKILEKSTSEIEKLGGLIENSEIIGRRAFARTLQKETHGTYAKVRFAIDPEAVKDIHEAFTHSEEHFRLQIVQRNERVEAAKAADDTRRAAFKAKAATAAATVGEKAPVATDELPVGDDEDDDNLDYRG